MMHRIININPTRIADAAAVSVNGFAAWTWIHDINEVLQLVLTIAGIVAAIAAARYHIIKTKEVKKDEAE